MYNGKEVDLHKLSFLYINLLVLDSDDCDPWSSPSILCGGVGIVTVDDGSWSLSLSAENTLPT